MEKFYKAHVFRPEYWRWMRSNFDIQSFFACTKTKIGKTKPLSSLLKYMFLYLYLCKIILAYTAIPMLVCKILSSRSRFTASISGLITTTVNTDLSNETHIHWCEALTLSTSFANRTKCLPSPIPQQAGFFAFL